MYGDSIFESLLGTGMARPDPQFADTPAVWQKHQGDIKTKIMAISGKQLLLQASKRFLYMLNT